MTRAEGSKVIRLPVRKRTRRDREIADGMRAFLDEGYSPELASVAAALCAEIDGLKKRLKRLEEKARDPR